MKNGRLQANVTSPHHILGLIAPRCLCVFTAKELSTSETSQYLSQEAELSVKLTWLHPLLCLLLFHSGKIEHKQKNYNLLHVIYNDSISLSLKINCYQYFFTKITKPCNIC